MAYRLVTLAKQAGFRGLFAGLGPRMVMTAGLVSGQFLLYGAIKDGASPTISSSFLSPEIDHCRCSFGRPAWAGDPQGDIRCSVRSAVTCQLDVRISRSDLCTSTTLTRDALRRRYMSVEITRVRDCWNALQRCKQSRDCSRVNFMEVSNHRSALARPQCCRCALRAIQPFA